MWESESEKGRQSSSLNWSVLLSLLFVGSGLMAAGVAQQFSATMNRASSRVSKRARSGGCIEIFLAKLAVLHYNSAINLPH